MTLDLDARLAELLSRVSARDAYELAVLQQVVAMPKATQADRDMRLVAYQRAMEQAPEES